MRTCYRSAILGALTLLALPGLWAQEPASTPEPGPAQAASQNAYPDIDSLREPGSSAKLFPEQTAAATPTGQGNGNGNGNGQRNNPILNHTQRRRGTRSNDVLVDQADADPLAVRVAYRRAKTVAMVRDPGLADLLLQADTVRTDVQKRAVLKVYYTRLFAGVRKVDGSPEMKKHVDLLAQVAKQRYEPQRRTVGGEEDLIRGGGGGRRGRQR